MFLICLSLIGLIAVTLVTEQRLLATEKAEELIPVPVRVNEAKTFSRNTLRRQAMQLKLIRFLQEELKIPASHIKLALDKIPQTPEQLPMMLWQYGLISLKQLELLWDWQQSGSLLQPGDNNNFAIQLREVDPNLRTIMVRS